MNDQSISERDQRFMLMAIDEARRGGAATAPNPMVGCVIVRDDRVVARGHHARCGGPHAEVDALANIDGSAEGCEVYVSLEPCSHVGRTPPCVDALISGRVRRVVAAMIDPDPRVSGRGMELLREAGIETAVGVCESESRELNRGFISRVNRQRPWIFAKLASSLDGKIATRTGDSKWITGESARERVHQLRASSNIIMIGAGTARADKPRLNARPGGVELGVADSPHRYVLDARATCDASDPLFDVSLAATTLFCGDDVPASTVTAFEDRGVRVERCVLDDDGRIPVDVPVRRAYADGAAVMMVEGGAELVGSMHDAGQVDSLMLFIAPLMIGGRDATTSIAGDGVKLVSDARRAVRTSVEQLGDDFLIRADFY